MLKNAKNLFNSRKVPNFALSIGKKDNNIINTLKFSIMNKEIALSFTSKLNKIGELNRAIIDELRANLIKMGQQDCVFDDGESAVPIYYLNDDNAETLVFIDKIMADESGIIKFHDVDSDEWQWLSYLDNDAIHALIEYIDWK